MASVLSLANSFLAMTWCDTEDFLRMQWLSVQPALVVGSENWLISRPLGRLPGITYNLKAVIKADADAALAGCTSRRLDFKLNVCFLFFFWLR